MTNIHPKFKCIIKSLFIVAAAGSIGSAHASEAVSSESTEQTQKMAEATPVLPTGSISAAAPEKSREQIVAELLAAKRDGSYIAPSEIYPERLN